MFFGNINIVYRSETTTDCSYSPVYRLNISWKIDHAPLLAFSHAYYYPCAPTEDT